MKEPASVLDPVYAAGIRVRRTPEQARGWDYAIPAIQRDWDGPYPSEGEAIAAAVRFLIQSVQQGTTEHPTSIESASPATQQHRAVERRAVLEQRLHQLELQADKSGVHAPPQIMIEIEDIRRRLASLDSVV